MSGNRNRFSVRRKIVLCAIGLALFAAAISGPPARGADREATAEQGKPKAGNAPALQVGLASVDITPQEPVWLYGYATPKRRQPFDAILDHIYAQALAVADAAGEKAVLVTADLCVLREAEERLLTERITKKTGLARRQVLLNWSHTHSGPMLGESDINRYPISAEDRQRTMAYTESLANNLAAVAAAALADLKPARLAYGVGEVSFVKSRRVFDAQGRYQKMGPSPDQPADRSVPVLRVDSPDGKPRAVLFGCACHAVTLGGDSNKLSGDYPSYARQAIQQRLPGVQSLFMAGCGADANPDPRATTDQEQWVRRHGEQLGAEVCRLLAGSLRPVCGPFHAAMTWVDLPLQSPPPEDRLKELAKGPFWQSHCAKRMLAALAAGEPLPSSYRAPLALWRFGNDLTLAAISGEVVCDYARSVPRALNAGPVWVAGYSNQVFGYLPSARIVKEGGYEALGFPSGPIGWFSEKAEQVVCDAMREMAQCAAQPGR